ncbi:23S rRNA methylase [Candidatus Methanoperedens nitroreducens]|uniref:Ribosomal RNA large subunit methyltransferase E n=1 Tax=Candidatus Methanoperedens nitratireducens TaxID=1392998 RepID=A0A062UYX2_9EURY|nr:23S rRNA (uridine(2552)-2'-O)-methyltransferase [Candidatus Methanoperedens nitroreducens]KCZ72131.1 23S rRNA methylase [Candidatus Methanoperedens nitroreducens]MDJ1421892.1 23S rRNA (uridine(2552)-2'-O)-methyltransferase [Candidatus Methanoperedens sp.]
MPRDRRDYYYRKAKEKGYRSRAAFKLKQINERFNIIRKGDTVVDLGAAPGGWLQVAHELSGAKVVGVDILPIEEIEGVETIKGDIRLDSTVEKIKKKIKEGADVVICDAAPSLSGSWSYDHARSIDLAESALECARKLLKPDGRFVVKVFQGDMFPDFLNKVRDHFVKVQAFSPQATRKQSAEIYVIGKRLLPGLIKINQEYTVTIEDIGASGDGIARINDFVIFVKDAKKGERLNIRIRDVKPHFAFGERIE